MLMFDIKRSVIKLENEAVALFPVSVSENQNQMFNWVRNVATEGKNL